MPLSCFQPVDSDVRNVDLLYDGNNDKGHLWSGGGAPPLCSSTFPPPPSSCVVCLNPSINTVCNLQENVTLVMEGAGRLIDIKMSECPLLLGDDSQHLWLLLLFILLIVFIFICASVACCKLRKWYRCQRA